MQGKPPGLTRAKKHLRNGNHPGREKSGRFEAPTRSPGLLSGGPHSAFKNNTGGSQPLHSCIAQWQGAGGHGPNQQGHRILLYNNYDKPDTWLADSSPLFSGKQRTP